ncbi:hypothetical protein CTAYLR_007683 [Chrysophaeum taylorii]|uniref:EF-hand domain-containing protein n=1 Tax=Chrysophaeum taylorii TaxID=2483200 RepID=A0AAD7U6A5_9STRA|nr:hypothetical protein CTAYLR_007683 [Chrysophaeum taylorii]
MVVYNNNNSGLSPRGTTTTRGEDAWIDGKKKWGSPQASKEPYLAPYGEARIRRRWSFDDRDGQPLTLFHELRSFFDAEYRLERARHEMVRVMRERDWGMNQLLREVDTNESGDVDATELDAAIRRLGVQLRQAEVTMLVEELDADRSGTVDSDELFEFLFQRPDPGLERVVRRETSADPHNNVALLCRDSARFDPIVMAHLEAFWHIVDADDNGVITKDEYLNLHWNMYDALRTEGEQPKDRNDWLPVVEREWEVDSRGRHFLDRQLFGLSMYQLADAWSAENDDTAKKNNLSEHHHHHHRTPVDRVADARAKFLCFLIDRVAQLNKDSSGVDLRWRIDPEKWTDNLEPVPPTGSKKRESHFQSSLMRGANLVTRLVPRRSSGSRRSLRGGMTGGIERSSNGVVRGSVALEQQKAAGEPPPPPPLSGLVSNKKKKNKKMEKKKKNRPQRHLALRSPMQQDLADSNLSKATLAFESIPPPPVRTTVDRQRQPPRDVSCHALPSSPLEEDELHVSGRGRELEPKPKKRLLPPTTVLDDVDFVRFISTAQQEGGVEAFFGVPAASTRGFRDAIPMAPYYIVANPPNVSPCRSQFPRSDSARRAVPRTETKTTIPSARDVRRVPAGIINSPRVLMIMDALDSEPREAPTLMMTRENHLSPRAFRRRSSSSDDGRPPPRRTRNVKRVWTTAEKRVQLPGYFRAPTPKRRAQEDDALALVDSPPSRVKKSRDSRLATTAGDTPAACRITLGASKSTSRIGPYQTELDLGKLRESKSASALKAGAASSPKRPAARLGRRCVDLPRRLMPFPFTEQLQRQRPVSAPPRAT